MWTDSPSVARRQAQLMQHIVSVLVRHRIHSIGFPRSTWPPLCLHLARPLAWCLGFIRRRVLLGWTFSTSFYWLVDPGEPGDHFPRQIARLYYTRVLLLVWLTVILGLSYFLCGWQFDMWHTTHMNWCLKGVDSFYRTTQSAPNLGCLQQVPYLIPYLKLHSANIIIYNTNPDNLVLFF
jgi:hypothetical protein